MTKPAPPPYHFQTTAVHAGLQPDPSTGAIITPIYQTATFALADNAEQQPYEYARVDNPTRTALQEALAALENGHYALAFSSGPVSYTHLRAHETS